MDLYSLFCALFLGSFAIGAMAAVLALTLRPSPAVAAAAGGLPIRTGLLSR